MNNTGNDIDNRESVDLSDAEDNLEKISTSRKADADRRKDSRKRSDSG